MEIYAEYAGGNVVVKSEDDISSLLQRGYGNKANSLLYLHPCEALYLLEKKKIKVVDSKAGTELSFDKLLEKFKLSRGGIWSDYLVYRDLREKGYVAKQSSFSPIVFEVYERGRCSGKTKYAIIRINEGSPVKIESLVDVAKKCSKLGKELILAVIDRRSEVVYYTLSLSSLM